MDANLAKPAKLLALEGPGRPDPLLLAFTTVVDRLEGVIEAETLALTGSLPSDMAAFNRQKRQGMLELSRLMRGFPPNVPHREVTARLAKLAESLERNRLVLDVQLRAVREIADIIAQVMRDAESDGTYSARAGWQ